MDVLLIEDDVDTGDAMAMLLELAGFDLRWARSGREALLIWESLHRNGGHHPDVLLLDLRLPDTPGEVLVEQLGERGAVPPVVLYSASSPAELRAAAGRVGAAAALRKPCAVGEIVAALRGAIATRAEPPQARTG